MRGGKENKKRKKKEDDGEGPYAISDNEIAAAIQEVLDNLGDDAIASIPSELAFPPSVEHHLLNAQVKKFLTNVRNLAYLHARTVRLGV